MKSPLTNGMVWMAGILLLAGGLACLQNDRPRSTNEASRLALIDSLLTRGQTDVVDSCFFNSVDIVERGGKYYSDKPPLLSLYTAALLRPLVPPMRFLRPSDQTVLYRIAVVSLNGMLWVVVVITMLRTAAAAEIGIGDTIRAGYQILLGTLLLAYTSAYASHFAEAALTLCIACAVAADRARERARHAALAGVCAGLQWSLHPLSGLIVIPVSFLAFGLTRPRQAVVFLICAAGLVAAGLAVHYQLYGTWKFFYFNPENYLFLWGPYKQQLSEFFLHPNVPGMTEERIAARIRELRLPDRVSAETVEHLRQYRQSVANPFRYAFDRFVTKDFLVFNPLVFASMLVWLRAAVRETGKRRFDSVWFALMIAGIYAGSVFLRTQSGFSFGDRYLVPAAVVALAGSWICRERHRFEPLLAAAFFVSFPMMLPGLMRSWEPTAPGFIRVNLALTLGFYGLSVLWVFSSRIRERLDAAWAAFGRIPVVFLAVFWSLSVLEILMSLQGPLHRPWRWTEGWIPSALTLTVSAYFLLFARWDSERKQRGI